MNAQQKNSKQILAVLLPGLFLIVMLVTPLLSQDKFYYKGHFDPKWFYEAYCNRVIQTPNGPSNGNGNEHFLAADMYYPELNGAGFNCTVTSSGMLDSNWYGNIKLFTNKLNIDAYGHAQHRWYHVGNNVLSDYFCEPLIGWAGEDPDEPFDEIIFYCNKDTCDSGFVIDDTLWGGDHRFPRNYRVELRVKYRNAGSVEDDTLLQITIGDNTEMLSDEWCQIMDSPTIDEPDPPPSTDSVGHYILRISDFDQEGVYETHVIETGIFGHYHFETFFKLYWYDQADMYLDWIHIYDAQYEELAIEQSVNEQLQDWISYFSDTSLVEHLYIDEPHQGEFDAVHLVDSLTMDTIGVHLFANLAPWNDKYYHDFIAKVDPPMLCQNLYTIYDEISTKSDTIYDYSIQRAWDRLLDHHDSYNTGFPEDEVHRGLLPFAEIADSANIPWFSILQAQGEWYPYYNSGNIIWDPWYRNPTHNEIFCEAYIAMSCGAKGIGYYHASSSFWRRPTAAYWVYYPNPNSPGLATCRGIFDLVMDTTGGDTTYPDLEDFPDVLHEGFFLPNYKYYAVKHVNEELNIIDDVLLTLDWDTSFCTLFKGDVTTGYDYIDSVWTVGDDTPTPTDWRIDSTFVQVGVFDKPGSLYDIDKHLMLVNRRCLENEDRQVHVGLNFGEQQACKCFLIFDYLEGALCYRTTNPNGYVEIIPHTIAPGHGRLLNIRDLYPTKMVIDTNAVVDWGPDTTIFVADTVEVNGTLRVHPGTYIRLCECIDGILVKPGGHLTIRGTSQNPVTIDGVADPVNGKIKMWGSGQDTIMYCNIRNLDQGVGFGVDRTVVMKHVNISKCNTGVFSVGGSVLHMDSCTVDSCTCEGIYLGSEDDGNITHCTIKDNGEAGIRLHEVMASFRVGHNVIEGNNTNQDSSYEALHIYKCSPIVYRNFIQNNEQDGVGAYHQSHPEFNKTPGEQGGALNKLTDNNDVDEGNHIYLNYSSAVLYNGHNDIFNDKDDTTTLITWREQPCLVIPYKIYSNYYGDWKSEPSWAFDMDCAYRWVPKDGTPNVQEWEPDELAEAFDEAVELEFNGLYARAINAYIGVITDYPTSSLALASLDRMLGCYQAMNGNIPTLQLLYEGIRDTTENEILRNKARQMAIRCLTNRRQYDQAIDRLENILRLPGLTLTDSVYTLIDIANVHMQAYYDSLICSWDSTCDPIARRMSADNNNRRSPQPYTNLDMIQSNTRRTPNRQSKSSPNDCKKKNRASSADDDRSHTPMNFTRAVNTNRPQLNLGGTYVMERASYPISYIAEYRPEDDRDYRQRVKNLMTLLRKGEYHPRVYSPPPIPDEYFLSQNYPNPFNPITTIRYGLPEASHVNITIYNILGREVVSLVNEHKPAGYYSALWNSKSHQGIEVSSGVYFYRIKANDFVDVKKMVLLR